jgi:alkylation response protein AidB-like acyl-CoA dehydrogenase
VDDIEHFRNRARAWLGEHARPFTEADDMGRFSRTPFEVATKFHQELYSAGFVGISWPREYGGQGLGVRHQVAFDAEATNFEMLNGVVFAIAIGNIGPTIIEIGAEEQKRRYLPNLLSGEEFWCQLFSEPRGGSDLASLQTKATRTANGWLLNGQKVWTSGAQRADLGLVVARTDPTVPKHQGITMFIVDMKQPGVSVRPLKVATGDSPFNEVFFDDVAVSDDSVLGELNKGWDAIMVTLRHERVGFGTGSRRRSSPLRYDVMAELARELGLTSNVGVRRQLAEVFARDAALTWFPAVLFAEDQAGVQIGARGSVGKLAGAEYRLWAGDAAQQIFGSSLVLGDPPLVRVATDIIASPASGIEGGTNEIQRNIIAERVLGLPKDPGVDRNKPFDQLRLG